MIRAVKIRLLPTPEQEQLFWKSAGAARWAWNAFLAANDELYRAWKESGGLTPSAISGYTFHKYITRILKPNTHRWLKEVSCKVVNQAILDAENARQSFFKGKTGKPRYKSRRRSKISFYVCYESLIKTKEGFRGAKIGIVKTARPLPETEGHYSNPRISFDGKNWYLAVGYKVEPKKVELTGKTIGIDLGIRELAVVSDGTVYHNINKTERIRQLVGRLKREQRKLSRKLDHNVESYTISMVIGKDGKEHQARRPNWKRPLDECKNISRQIAKIQAIHKKLTDIRQNHTHQATRAIVKAKPSRIVMETLNIKGLLKNHRVARMIAEQKWYDFKKQIRYKAEEYGIEVIEVNQFYASSKTCSKCGHVKKDLKLSDRTYRCSECGLVIDRDLNAAINLAHYPS